MKRQIEVTYITANSSYGTASITVEESASDSVDDRLERFASAIARELAYQHIEVQHIRGPFDVLGRRFSGIEAVKFHALGGFRPQPIICHGPTFDNTQIRPVRAINPERSLPKERPAGRSLKRGKRGRKAA